MDALDRVRTLRAAQYACQWRDGYVVCGVPAPIAVATTDGPKAYCRAHAEAYEHEC